MLVQLVYVSTATTPMSGQDLKELLEQSRERNTRHAVTGMLLYKNRRFIQLLEGREDDVQAVFESIKRDERHEDIQLLWYLYSQFRDFPDWTMGFRNIEDVDARKLKGFTPFLERDFRYEKFIENSTDVHAMLMAFRDNPEAMN